MGLLQKAHDHSSNSPQIRREKFPVIKARLLKINNTINFHPALFKELVTLFSIEKGALLLRDGDNFTLSSIVGYDETTSHRLRFTKKEYKEYLQNSDISKFQRYFSIREFKTLNNVLLIPFRSNNVVEGLLLISEFSTEKHPEYEELTSYAQELETLWTANPLNRLQNTDTQSSDIKESITSFVQRIKNSSNRVIFLKMNLKDLVLKIKETDSLSTDTSIRNNAMKVLTSFTNKRGRVFQLSGNQIMVILLDKQCSINATVIQQQITSAFNSIFSRSIESLDLSFENLIWKDNSLDTILDHFIPDGSN